MGSRVVCKDGAQDTRTDGLIETLVAIPTESLVGLLPTVLDSGLEVAFSYLQALLVHRHLWVHTVVMVIDMRLI